MRAGLDPGFRPDLGVIKKDADIDPQMVTLMRDCWIEDPVVRPDIKHVKAGIKQMSRGRFAGTSTIHRIVLYRIIDKTAKIVSAREHCWIM